MQIKWQTYLALAASMAMQAGCMSELAVPRSDNPAFEDGSSDVRNPATQGAGGSDGIAANISGDLTPDSSSSPRPSTMMGPALNGGTDTSTVDASNTGGAVGPAAGVDRVGGTSLIGGEQAEPRGGIAGQSGNTAGMPTSAGTLPPDGGELPLGGATDDAAGDDGSGGSVTPLPVGGTPTNTCQLALDGAPCTVGVGACARTGRWQCEDQTLVCDIVPGLPSAEVCNGIDDDCDGLEDNTERGCDCEPGTQVECYPEALDGEPGVGACTLGLRTCLQNGQDYGPCIGAVGRSAERCNGIDDDCNGLEDDLPNLGQPCASGLGQCRQTGNLVCDPAVSLNVICNAEPLNSISPDVCDGLDNDCDGVPDNPPTGCACMPGEQQRCFPFPSAQAQPDIGICRAGLSTCLADGSGFGPCEGAIGPGDEVCNGLDDDCNGMDDDAPSIGGPCSVGQGACERRGTLRCAEGLPDPVCSAQSGRPDIDSEVCNGIDDDCNGIVDDLPELDAACTSGIGECARNGTLICDTEQSLSLVCNAAAGPREDEVCNGLDDNCDGQIDNVAALRNDDGEPVVCQARWPEDGAEALGSCAAAGVLICAPGESESPVCSASPTPRSEEICNELDDDCDGIRDNVAGVGAECAAVFPDGSTAFGPCANTGRLVCSPDVSQTPICDARPSRAPEQERCNGVDDNCDGIPDNTAAACACEPNIEEACYGFGDDTRNRGRCADGVRRCNETGTAWGPCIGQIGPEAESCNGEDDDCDGINDNAIDGLGEPCTALGADGLEAVGVCAATGELICDLDRSIGSLVCSARGANPQPESCNGRDDDCNGFIDDTEGCDCTPYSRTRGNDVDSTTSNAHLYFLCTTPRSWQDARINCQNYGADLAVITSESENEFIKEQIFDSDRYGDQLFSSWIGLSDADREGEFRWIDGFRVISYLVPNWEGGLPDLCLSDASCGDGLRCRFGSCQQQIRWEFAEFGTGEPNNFGGSITNAGEDCTHYSAAFADDEQVIEYYGWNDLSCGTELASICEQTCEPGQDDDGDGYLRCGSDCDDNNGSTHPGAIEVNGDGVDNDCDGVIDNEACFDQIDNNGNNRVDENCQPCVRREWLGKTYLFCDLDETYNWYFARYFCIDQGMDLAIIDSLTEDEWVSEQIQSIDGEDTDWYIGLNDIENEGTLVWNAGPEGLTYPNPPWDGATGGNRWNRDCAFITDNDLEWRVRSCSVERNFICETEY